MGWFWGSSSSGDGENNTKPQDPLRGLDPSLREFLQKESPVKYDTTSPPSPTPSPASQTPQLPSSPSIQPAASQSPDDTSAPAAPRESLFPDGRYAHLWKTYHPQNQVESEGKSDQEKINDVLEGYNQRKAGIGRAALENCALEQEDVNECFRSGGVKARLTMCRAENRKLDRCYTVQAVCVL
jgi:hypothetical protein